MRIATDASCDAPSGFFEQNNIAVVPLHIMIHGREYLSSEISKQDFMKWMDSEVPRTSQPSPGDFMRVINEGYDTIITISSKLSGTYRSAMVASKLSGRDASVIDSLQASTPLFLFIKAFMDGMEPEQINSKIECFGMVETFRNLVANGRVGKASALVGRVLGIKPLIELKGGELVPLRKSRSRNAILDEFVKRNPDTDTIYITHVSADVSWLKERLEQSRKVVVVEAGPLISSHLGKGAIFISYMRDEA